MTQGTSRSPLTDTQLRATPVPVVGPLTDVELRATPVPISGLLGTGDIIVDAWGSQKVSLPYSLFHGMWTFDIPLNMWFMFENGVQVYTSTAITSIGGAGTLRTTAALGTLILESRETPRYQPNRGVLFSTALWCPAKTNSGVREWGLQTPFNGIFFRLKADGLLYAVRRSGGVEVAEEVIDTSGVTSFDVQKGNVYDIQFQWRGVGNYKFFINLKLVHTMSVLGTLSVLSIQNPALPISFKATRGTQDVSLYIGCADLASENGALPTEQYASSFAEVAPVNGTNIPVICMKQPLLINSVTNTRNATLARITFTCVKKATFKVWVTRNPAAIIGATFVSIATGSFIETDSPDRAVGAVRATSVNTALLQLVLTVPVEAAITRMVDNPDSPRISFILVRGDYLVITCTASATTADVTIEMGDAV